MRPRSWAERREICPCGDPACEYFEAGYPLCEPCEDHHPGPECPTNALGQPLAPCGHTWPDAEGDTHRHGCPGCAQAEPAEHDWLLTG